MQPVATFGGGGAQNATIQYVIKGPGPGHARRTRPAQIAARRRQRVPSLVDVDTSLNLGKPEVSVNVDRLKAADLGVQIADAANALRLLVGGDQVTTYFEGGEQYEVQLRAEAADRTTTAAIASLTVPSARLGSVALENVASFTRRDRRLGDRPPRPAAAGDDFRQRADRRVADARDGRHLSRRSSTWTSGRPTRPRSRDGRASSGAPHRTSCSRSCCRSCSCT